MSWVCQFYKFKYLLLILVGWSAHQLQADQIIDTSAKDWMDRALRFWSFDEPSLQVIVVGVLLVGTNCGLMGGYIVTRRLSMFGDTLSHAVLPGIAVGYIISQSRNQWGLMLGATLSGFIGVAIISLLKKYTKIKADSAMGLILASFYALGICLLSHLQQAPGGGIANLENYLFGSLVGLSQSDLPAIIACLCLIVLTFILLKKELLVSGFDPSFARSIGLPVDIIQFFLWALLAFCIVSSLQIIGVVLVSALLIIPAATSWLLTHRMSHLLILSAVIGSLSALMGCFFSFLTNHLPAGPTIILCSTFIFLMVLFCSPYRGIIPAWARSRKRAQRIRLENTLKASYQVLEEFGFGQESFTQSHLARRRGKSDGEIEQEVYSMIRQGFATRTAKTPDQPNELPSENVISLTPSGWEVACRMIRNHRLWELYLTNEASYAPDHVHDDAEKIEHIIGEKTVRQLERILENPRMDPHGKPIPGRDDIDRGWASSPSSSIQ